MSPPEPIDGDELVWEDDRGCLPDGSPYTGALLTQVGDLLIEHSLRNGLDDGVCRWWRAGVLVRERNYRNNSLHGWSREWSPEGILISERLHAIGFFLINREYDKLGRLTRNEHIAESLETASRFCRRWRLYGLDKSEDNDPEVSAIVAQCKSLIPNDPEPDCRDDCETNSRIGSDRGTIFVVGGINDVLFVTNGWRYGLTRAGLPHAVVPFRWQQGFVATLTFADLWRTAHHRASAADLAARIRAARADGPVHVVAHSAGTAITAYALEQLPPNEPATSAVLVGSALSPGYDLSAAVRGCAFGVMAVESWQDAFFLGLGTSLLGTADRVWTPAAGLVGFRPPADPAAAARFHRVRWHPRFVRDGWLGGHLSVASPRFAARTLADWVRRAEAITPAR